MLKIVEYDPSWPLAFECEARVLRKALGSAALAIEHVGSTAVPGLAAKPVIDIQVSVASLEPISAFSGLLAREGYTHVPLGEFDTVYPYFEKPKEWPHTHHVHVCQVGSYEERVHLAFRDFLRAHPERGKEYVELKRRLAAGKDGSSLTSREEYSLAKTDFVTRVVRAALRDGYGTIGIS